MAVIGPVMSIIYISILSRGTKILAPPPGPNSSLLGGRVANVSIPCEIL